MKLLLLYLVFKYIHKRWSNRKTEYEKVEAFRLKYAQHQIAKFQGAVLPKPRLTHAQFTLLIVLCYFFLSQFEWFPRS